ncbi:MAG TPA: PilN domain-containing protein [Rhizomicrobium sp.]|jgi:general secretion pathway protein L|nr:PilN domain-containing protein [Rhizomicrobium sp.]
MATPTFSASVGQFRSVAADLFLEWRRELARWARELLSSPWMRGGEIVLLDFRAGEVRIDLLGSGKVDHIGRTLGTGEIAAREISTLLAGSERVPRRTADVAMQLPREEVLRRHFELPAARRAVLARAVPFELERLSPIESDRLYYDFTVLQSTKARKQAELEIRIVKRTSVDSAVALAREAGLRVGAIRFAGDAREANWRSFPVDRTAWLKLKWRRWNVLALAGLAIVLALLVLFAAYLRGASAADELSAELDAASNRAAIVHRLAHEISDVQAQIEFPLAEKRAPFLLRILSEVTRELPDGTWLTEFELDSGKVHIQGFSKSASDVVGDIDRSPLFANAQFMAPLQSSQNGNERFDLSFDVKRPSDARPRRPRPRVQPQ